MGYNRLIGVKCRYCTAITYLHDSKWDEIFFEELIDIFNSGEISIYHNCGNTNSDNIGFCNVVCIQTIEEKFRKIYDVNNPSFVVKKL